MNIFDLSEKEMKEFLEKKLNDVTPEELLNELIECGLEMKEEIRIYDEAEYYNEYIQECCVVNATWSSTKTTGWTNFKQKFIGKVDESNKLEEAA